MRFYRSAVPIASVVICAVCTHSVRSAAMDPAYDDQWGSQGVEEKDLAEVGMWRRLGGYFQTYIHEGEDEKCQIPLAPVEEQCAYVRENCAAESEHLSAQLDYLDIYYCTLGTRDLKPLAVFVFATLLVFLFLFLGTASGDYFCPNLSTLSEALQLPQDVAGATFLALGNSAPDLVSSLVALHSPGAVGMAIGELLGSGLFIGAIVLGMVIVFARANPSETAPADFVQLKKQIFLRDSGFLFVAVLSLGVILITGKLFWWQGLILLAIYIIYVGFITRATLHARKVNTDSLLETCHGVCAIDVADGVESTAPSPATLQSVSGDTVSATTERIRSGNQRCHSFHASGYRKNDGVFERGTTAARSRTASLYHLALSASPPQLPVYPVGCRTCRIAGAGVTFGDLDAYLLGKTGKLHASAQTILLHLFPMVATWRNHGLPGKLLQILSVPAFFLLGLTIPVVIPREETEIAEQIAGSLQQQKGEEISIWKKGSSSQTLEYSQDRGLLDNDESSSMDETPFLSKSPIEIAMNLCATVDWHHRFIVIGQLFLAPLFSVYAIGCFSVNVLPAPLYLPGYALGLVVGVILSALMFYFVQPRRYIHRLAALYEDTEPNHDSSNRKRRKTLPWRSPLIAFIGFLVGILWIYVIARELVGLLKAVGKILKINDAILGVTVLAFGNSIGDLVSNVTVARMGFPTMSISACFAGPLINLLMTLGFGGVLGFGGPPILIHRSINMLFTYAGLLFLVTITLVVVSVENFRLRRCYGFAILGIYAAIIVTTITLDLTISNLGL